LAFAVKWKFLFLSFIYVFLSVRFSENEVNLCVILLSRPVDWIGGATKARRSGKKSTGTQCQHRHNLEHHWLFCSDNANT
jgi:hypothetical protein